MNPDAPPPPAGPPGAALNLLAQAASAGITASAVAPQFGGKVAISGPTVVEVMPRTDGLVLAEVRDASGAPVTTGTVSVQVHAAGAPPRTVPLRYDTDLRVFEGNAGAELPATPSNVPIIGRSSVPNLYLNTGHGTLGWTHACGSGKSIARIVSGMAPEVDFAFAGIGR